MRSARMLMATAAASAVLALGAPGAYAVGEDEDHTTDSSYSKEAEMGQEKEKETEKEYGKEKEHGKESDHDSPRGGMHTGGGALSAVTEGDWSKQDSEPAKDSEPSKDSGTVKQEENSWTGKQEESSGSEKKDEESWSGEKDEESWGGKHEKPSGGVHTGGGALASPAVTAGGLAVLAVAGSGLYMARRKKSAGSVA